MTDWATDEALSAMKSWLDKGSPGTFSESFADALRAAERRGMVKGLREAAEFATLVREVKTRGYCIDRADELEKPD